MKRSLSRWSVGLFLLLSACISSPGGMDMRKSPAQQGSGPASTAEAPMMADQTVEPQKGAIPANAQTIKVALLLPLSGDSVAVGNAMMDAATMAISDSYLTVPSDQIRSQIVLVPKDTG